MDTHSQDLKSAVGVEAYITPRLWRHRKYQTVISYPVHRSDPRSCFQSLLTALSPVLLSLTNLKFLDLSPTIGIGRAQLDEELALCQAWSKVCGLSKVVFPSGDVWILNTHLPVLKPEQLQSDAWILAGGNTITNVVKPWWGEAGLAGAGRNYGMFLWATIAFSSGESMN